MMKKIYALEKKIWEIIGILNAHVKEEPFSVIKISFVFHECNK